MWLRWEALSKARGHETFELLYSTIELAISSIIYIYSEYEEEIVVESIRIVSSQTNERRVQAPQSNPKHVDTCLSLAKSSLRGIDIQ